LVKRRGKILRLLIPGEEENRSKKRRSGKLGGNFKKDSGGEKGRLNVAPPRGIIHWEKEKQDWVHSRQRTDFWGKKKRQEATDTRNTPGGGKESFVPGREREGADSRTERWGRGDAALEMTEGFLRKRFLS